MSQQQKYKLKQDIFSNSRERLQYGKKNEVVTLISVSEPVLIVESKSGNRYPVHKDEVVKFEA